MESETLWNQIPRGGFRPRELTFMLEYLFESENNSEDEFLRALQSDRPPIDEKTRDKIYHVHLPFELMP